MPNTILVSLISDQSIPNVLFIRDQPKADHYLFISTEKMEKKMLVANIIKACPSHIHSSSTIVVEEDNLEDIASKLASFNNDFTGEYVVNLTGGTKVMSLGVFEFFSKSVNNRIFYLPLGKNKIIQLFPKNSETELTFRIGLEDYLISNGVIPEKNSFDNKNNLSRKEQDTARLYLEFSSESNHILKQAAEHFRPYRQNDKIKRITLNNEERWYLQPFVNAGFSPSVENDLSRKEIKYCTGDWFEEYIYTLVKSIKGKSEDEIGVGVSLTREKVKNEFDVIFTHNNALYVIECKTDVANEEGKFADLFNNTLYKAGSLRKDFGLFVKFYVCAINDFTKLSQEKHDRARVLDVNLVGAEVLNDEEKMRELVSKM